MNLQNIFYITATIYLVLMIFISLYIFYQIYRFGNFVRYQKIKVQVMLAQVMRSRYSMQVALFKFILKLLKGGD
jgi:hypothetical protein